MKRTIGHNHTNGKPIALLVSVLLVVLLVLMGAPGVSVAQTVVATVTVGSLPTGVGVNPTTNKVYVVNQNSNNVSVIDGATDTVVGAPIPVGTQPYGVGVNPTNNKIYVANFSSNTVSVIDGATDTVIGAPISVGVVPTCVGVNPANNKVYVANWASGTVSVIDGATDTVVGAPIPVGMEPYGVGVNPTNNKIYVANYISSTVSVIDGATDTVIGTPISVGTQPYSVGVNPTTNKVYVVNQSSKTVSVIDGATDTVVGAPISVGWFPHGVGVNPKGNKVYVANQNSNNVSVIDGATDTVIGAPISVGTQPFGVGVNPKTNKVYVANWGSDTVSVIYDPRPEIWYLAEGSTAWGFDEYISIENPNPEACTAKITYMTSAGPTSPPNVTLPALSQTIVNPRDFLGPQDFSTKVECLEGKSIAVDRTMTWTGTGAASPEAHNSIGVTAPNNIWYLPEGSSAWDFECWLLIQNPNNSEVTCNVTYMVEGSGPHTVTKAIPANSRRTYNIADDIGNHDASIKVESNQKVISERAMYRHNRREGHDSIGTTASAKDYYLAEGTTAWGFTTYVLVQNPNPTVANVTITYMTPTGTKTMPTFQMAPNIRKTIRVNDELPNTDLSTQVHADVPIIAERAMYWGADTPLGEACHDSIGMSSPYTTFYLPDGETSNGRETWTLVQNPNPVDVQVEISYLTPDGKGDLTFPEKIPANSRRTFNMADKGISGRAAIMVTCKTAGQKIMVERAMYWNSRGAGTDTIGGYSD